LCSGCGHRRLFIVLATRPAQKVVVEVVAVQRRDYPVRYIGPVQAVQPTHVAEDLYAAVQWIVQDMEGVKR
jgi:hypothetical protein